MVVIDEEDLPESTQSLKGGKKLNQEAYKERTWKQLAYESGLIIWDGLGFFGFDETKLPRLTRGGKYYYTDKCTSIKWVLGSIAAFVVIVAVIASQVKNLGMVKSQSIQLKSQGSYSFNITEQMHMVAAIYFWMDKLMP